MSDRSDQTPPSNIIRLNALLARCGFGARRKAEEFITAGRVKVDGKVVTSLGTIVDSRKQKIDVDDEPVRPGRTAIYMVNKPKGMLCTHADPQGRPRVIDLFPKTAGRLFPIGRLDENSVGLLLVTNDGELCQLLAHPRYRVAKIYHVHVAGTPTPATLKQLKDGMYFADGKFKVDGIRMLKSRGQSAILEMTLREGQNREIRRLMARVGHKVMRLERLGFGPLRLKGVGPGQYRPLDRDEAIKLREYVDHFQERIDKEKAERQAKRAAQGERPPRERPAGRPERPAARSVEVSPMARRVAQRDLSGQRRDEVARPSGSSSQAGRARGGAVRSRREVSEDSDYDDDDAYAAGRAEHPARRKAAPPQGAASGSGAGAASTERRVFEASDRRPHRDPKELPAPRRKTTERRPTGGSRPAGGSRPSGGSRPNGGKPGSKKSGGGKGRR